MFTLQTCTLHCTPLCPLTPQDLQKVIYVDDNITGLLDNESAAGGSTEKAGPSGSEGQQADQRVGIRTLRVSPNGQHLASGDRVGVLR